MQHHHLTDADATASHDTASCSPAPMMKALRDPTNDTTHLPMPMTEAQSPGKQAFHLQYTTSHTTDPFLTKAWGHVISLFDKHLPTAPLDDDIWAEEEIWDRHLFIHERPDEPNHQCSCPYDSDTTHCMDLL